MNDDFFKNYRNEIKKIFEPLRKQMEELKSMFTLNIDFTKLMPNFEELGSELKAAGDDLIQFKTIIVELGYPPHDDLPIPIIRRIVYEYNNHGKDYVNSYLNDTLSEFYNEPKLESMLIKWNANPKLRVRLPILRNVMKCHKQQMYHASIPSLLPQLEGMIADTFQHKGQLKGYQLKTYLKHLLLVPDGHATSLSYEEALHSYYIQYVLVNFEHGKTIHSQVSRHAILHGGYYEYGTKENSLKLILLFDYLCDSFSKLKEETIEKAKEEIKLMEKNK
ncbi:hypothetical protein CHH83_02505 [Bacillus sp. 7586-K]|nr:hypothetical protein CHH83_02505 [Bacillus sp. 7586-K]